MRLFSRWRWSLQTLILVMTVAISATVFYVSDKVSMMSSVRIVENQLGRQSANTARDLATELVRLQPYEFTNQFVALVGEVFEREPSIVRVDVYADYGNDIRLLASSYTTKDRPLEGQEIASFYSGRPDTFIIEDGPKRRIFSIYPFKLSDGRNAFLTVVTSLRTIDEIWTTHARIRLYSILASTLLLVVAITLVFRTVVYRGIQHLLQVMRRFRNGETAVRARENLIGEFGLLAHNFNHMLGEIENLNTHMQDQIEEATTALSQRNQELQGLNLRMFEMQKRLAQTERLALVGQLTATFAHEIGSPLSAVSTHLQLLQEDPELDDRTRARIGTSIEQVDRVCGIVEGLLHKTRRDSRIKILDLGALVQGVTQLLGPTLESRGVTLDFRPDGGPFNIRGNADELQQLVLNLFNNALDAMEQGGNLTVSMGMVEDENNHPRVRLVIADTGPGIDPAQLERIFEPFFTTKEFGKGTGLGLTVCQDIVKRHEGSIEAANKPDGGASFRLEFPTDIEPATGVGNGNAQVQEGDSES